MIIWIASYPKSGNTWMRSFLSSYIYMKSNENTFNFNLLKNIKKFPQLNQFQAIGIIPKNFKEVAKSWIPAQNKINSNNKVNFLKTHNAFGELENYSFTNKENTLGLIHLVRDPRDVLISYNYHMNQSFNETLKWVVENDHKNYLNGVENVYGEIVGSWSQHYNSWKNYSLSKKILIKYEDLIENPFDNFLKVINFLNQLYGLQIDKKKILKCIEITNFSNMQKLEKKFGFEEKYKGNKNLFFKKGKKDQWKDQLDKKITKKIEGIFNREMIELNYI